MNQTNIGYRGENAANSPHATDGGVTTKMSEAYLNDPKLATEYGDYTGNRKNKKKLAQQ
jgi:hypothetical protein